MFDSGVDQRRRRLIGISGSIVLDRAVSLVGMALQDSKRSREIHVSGFALFVDRTILYMTNAVSVGEHFVDRFIGIVVVVRTQSVAKIWQGTKPWTIHLLYYFHKKKWILAQGIVRSEE